MGGSHAGDALPKQGSIVGCVPLALVGLAGAQDGVPTMVLFRRLLGVRGSSVPSVLNVAQLVGWTGFEFWAMALVANEMSKRIIGETPDVFSKTFLPSTNQRITLDVFSIRKTVFVV